MLAGGGETERGHCVAGDIHEFLSRGCSVEALDPSHNHGTMTVYGTHRAQQRIRGGHNDQTKQSSISICPPRIMIFSLFPQAPSECAFHRHLAPPGSHSPPSVARPRHGSRWRMRAPIYFGVGHQTGTTNHKPGQEMQTRRGAKCPWVGGLRRTPHQGLFTSVNLLEKGI